MELIDTHVHLTMPDYEKVGGVGKVLERAKAVGVTQCVAPGLDLASSKQVIELHNQYPQIIPAIGLHPLSPDEPLEPFKELARDPAVKAIGEIGTDSKVSDWDAQAKRFRFFLDLAVEVNKPVLIHIRGIWEPTLEILKDYPQLKGKGVIHCFTGTVKEAEAIEKLGLLISCTAILTREETKPTHDAIGNWPLERLMLETDAPWLMWPGEDWPNEPRTVAKIAELVAKIKGITAEEVAEATTKTARQFFSL